MSSKFTLAAVPALAAAFSLTATPVLAAEISPPVASSSVAVAPAWAPGNDNAQDHRGYPYRRYRHGSGVGDLLTGILIVGGIAAIANAATRNARSYPTRYPYPRDGRYNDGYDGESRGLDRAVSMCADEVERNARIGSIDTANRTAEGWSVSGSLATGGGFTCSIGQDGRILGIDYGQDRGEYYRGSEAGENRNESPFGQGDDQQYGDETYADARAMVDGAQPAYPGGPLPGDDGADADADAGAPDSLI